MSPSGEWGFKGALVEPGESTAVVHIMLVWVIILCRCVEIATNSPVPSGSFSCEREILIPS